MSNSTEKTRRLVGMSIFTALVIVLQLVATFVKIGTFPVTLTLVPVVIVTGKVPIFTKVAPSPSR